jgi:type III restriction enzyme
VIHQSTDRLQGETPVHFVQATRPILILDEPQNMESELRIKALAALDPLFALRYSATHRNPYNLVYRLTPYQAYRQRLVKRIEVASVVSESDANRVFVRLLEVRTEKRTLRLPGVDDAGLLRRRQTFLVRPRRTRAGWPRARARRRTPRARRA